MMVHGVCIYASIILVYLPEMSTRTIYTIENTLHTRIHYHTMLRSGH